MEQVTDPSKGAEREAGPGCCRGELSLSQEAAGVCGTVSHRARLSPEDPAHRGDGKIIAPSVRAVETGGLTATRTPWGILPASWTAHVTGRPAHTHTDRPTHKNINTRGEE